MRRNYLGALCDHLDLRVRDRYRARSFYDPLCRALGLTRVTVGDRWTSYESDDETGSFVAITSDPDFVASAARIAFRADSNAEVDRIAAEAHAAGACAYEAPHACPEYGEGYYAAFFADSDGNRYEICFRPLSATIARLWRGRVRPGLLDDYRGYVESTGMEDYARTDGNRGAYLLTQSQETHGDVLTLSFWRSRDAIAGFSGEPIERARYYPQDERFLLDFPERVEHFNVDF